MNLLAYRLLFQPGHRIVIDKNLRAMFAIPETGTVQLLMSKNYLQLFPCSATVPKAIRKEISIARFDLPMLWANNNGIKVGDPCFPIGDR